MKKLFEFTLYTAGLFAILYVMTIAFLDAAEVESQMRQERTCTLYLDEYTAWAIENNKVNFCKQKGE